MDSPSRNDYATLAVGFIVVAGILYISFSAGFGEPSGFAVAGSPAPCCGDCSCVASEACLSCGGRCVWTSDCARFYGGLNPEGLELIGPGRVRDDETFTLNAVLDPPKDGRILLLVRLPNGFEVVGQNPTIASLKAGTVSQTPFRIRVKEHVAEQDHKILVESIDSDWKVVSHAEATVNVWWENRLNP
jgi:hypothetical protein